MKTSAINSVSHCYCSMEMIGHTFVTQSQLTFDTRFIILMPIFWISNNFPLDFKRPFVKSQIELVGLNKSNIFASGLIQSRWQLELFEILCSLLNSPVPEIEYK